MLPNLLLFNNYIKALSRLVLFSLDVSIQSACPILNNALDSRVTVSSTTSFIINIKIKIFCSFAKQLTFILLIGELDITKWNKILLFY